MLPLREAWSRMSSPAASMTPEERAGAVDLGTECYCIQTPEHAMICEAHRLVAAAIRAAVAAERAAILALLAAQMEIAEEYEYRGLAVLAEKIRARGAAS